MTSLRVLVIIRHASWRRMFWRVRTWSLSRNDGEKKSRPVWVRSHPWTGPIFSRDSQRMSTLVHYCNSNKMFTFLLGTKSTLSTECNALKLMMYRIFVRLRKKYVLLYINVFFINLCPRNEMWTIRKIISQPINVIVSNKIKYYHQMRSMK